MSRKILAILIGLIIPFALSAMTVEDVPNVHLQNRTRYVSDPENYLSASEIARADSIIGSIWNGSSAEVVAVVVKDMSGKDVDTYATELFRHWGLGKKDTRNGVLVLISVDDRKYSIRTGKGIEGVLPDILCGRIGRDLIAPAMKEGRVGDAVINSSVALREIINKPEAAEEIMSKYGNDERKTDWGKFFGDYLTISLIALVVILLIIAYNYYPRRKADRQTRYEALRQISVPVLASSFIFLGLPLIAWGILKSLMNRVRRSTPSCPNCSHKMRLIDEVHDNDHLTPAQDCEERIGSVDYDVWHCDNCQADEIIPYLNPKTVYTVCPNCGSRAEQLVSNEVTQRPTVDTAGKGCKTYYCKNCEKHRKKYYNIAKLAGGTGMLFIPGFGGRGGRGFGGGGGFSGGSFGGGTTGGGGASGGW